MLALFKQKIKSTNNIIIDSLIIKQKLKKEQLLIYNY